MQEVSAASDSELHSCVFSFHIAERASFFSSFASVLRWRNRRCFVSSCPRTYSPFPFAMTSHRSFAEVAPWFEHNCSPKLRYDRHYSRVSHPP